MGGFFVSGACPNHGVTRHGSALTGGMRTIADVRAACRATMPPPEGRLAQLVRALP